MNNPIFLRNVSFIPEDAFNDDFFLAIVISSFTIFFTLRKIVYVYVGWGPFFFLGWFYVIENIALTFLEDTEAYLYFFFFFNIFYIICIYVYLVSWYYKTFVMYCYTFYEYEHYYWNSVLDTFRYKISKSFLTKYYLNKEINKNILNFFLDYKFNLYLKLLSYFYIIFFLIFFYIHTKNLHIWFDFSIADIPALYNTYYNIIVLILYYVLFLKLIINSIFFDKLISINFLRSLNLISQSGTSDDALNWTGRYWELVLFYSETDIEENGLYIIGSVLGDWDFKKFFKFWSDFDSSSAYDRFVVPVSWLNYKTYVVDSYNENIAQFLLYKLYHFIIFILDYFHYVMDYLEYTEVEFILKLKL